MYSSIWLVEMAQLRTSARCSHIFQCGTNPHSIIKFHYKEDMFHNLKAAPNIYTELLLVVDTVWFQLNAFTTDSCVPKAPEIPCYFFFPESNFNVVVPL
jgi:hypothetical protein